VNAEASPNLANFKPSKTALSTSASHAQTAETSKGGPNSEHPQDCNQRINLRQLLGVELQDFTATREK
jgi:hypothetical protein